MGWCKQNRLYLIKNQYFFVCLLIFIIFVFKYICDKTNYSTFYCCMKINQPMQYDCIVNFNFVMNLNK